MIAPVSDGAGGDVAGVCFSDLKEEYLRWGTLKGGRKGRPWSATHAAHRKRYLNFWDSKLGLSRISAFCSLTVKGMMPRVEEILCELREKGIDPELMGRKQKPKPLSGKSLNNFCEGLSAFFQFCVKRGYLDADPLVLLDRFDSTPQVTRRAMTKEEIAKLLGVATPARRLVYETALASGLRRNELRQLSLEDLDVIRPGLRLRSDWTKNRKAEFQPIPKWLADKLAQSGRENAGKLLKMALHPERMLKKDLIKADVDIDTADGYLDFHALRATFTTLVHESGANDKETQSLARHSSSTTTFSRYVKTRETRLSEITDRVGELIKGDGNREKPKTVSADPTEVVRAEMPNVQVLDQTVNKNPGVRIKLTGIFELVEVMGVEPLTPNPSLTTLPITSFPAISKSNHAPAAPPKSGLSPDVGPTATGAFPTAPEDPMNLAAIRARAETHAIAVARAGIAGNVQLLQSAHDVFHLLENPFSIDHILALQKAFTSIDLAEFVSTMNPECGHKVEDQYAQARFHDFQEDPLHYLATRNPKFQSEALLRLALSKMQQQ